jgi:hypothetical protein
MSVIAAAVDWDALLQVIWVSLATGVGVTAVFGIAILGATRAVDLGRDGHVAPAVIFGALTIVALAAVAAAVILGILAMTDK